MMTKISRKKNKPNAPANDAATIASSFRLSKIIPSTPAITAAGGAINVTYNCPTVASGLPHDGRVIKPVKVTITAEMMIHAAILP